jgi:signal peptidase I
VGRFALVLGWVAIGIAVAGCVTINVGTSTDAAPSSDPCATGAPTHRVEQQSMEPTLEPGDIVAVLPASTYGRADIVVFRPPDDWIQPDGTPFIKRVIAVGGDTVEIKDDGFVYLNGVQLKEPYVHEATLTSTDTPRWQIPDGDLFVMGDHRATSADSRTFGPIPTSAVAGRVTFRCSGLPGPVS